MSSIGKKDDGAKKVPTIAELESQYGEIKVSIKKLRDKNKSVNDVRGMDSSDRQQLKILYVRAAQMARKLAERVLDDEASAKYRAEAQKLNDAAKKYGSVITNEVPKTTMDDIKGLQEAKDLVNSFLFMAAHPELVKHYRLNGGLGMLMYGAPGTGKTMFAEAIANSMQLPLFIMTPADIFKSYVGESEQAVKQIFDEIDACEGGAILFVDECESIFSKRTADSKDYKAAVTTEILQRMNGLGVDGSRRVIIAATNRPSQIDIAYLRYKRFSHLLHILPPDIEAKRAIITAKLRGIDLGPDLDIETIVNMTERVTIEDTNIGQVATGGQYYTGADLCGIIEEACRIAMKQVEINRGTKPIPVTLEMFERAFDKIKPSVTDALLDDYKNFERSAIELS